MACHNSTCLRAKEVYIKQPCATSIILYMVTTPMVGHLQSGLAGLCDTTSSVTGDTFQSNISLVGPTVQLSRTEKQLVEWGVPFTIDQVKNLLKPLPLPRFSFLIHRGQWLQHWQQVPRCPYPKGHSSTLFSGFRAVRKRTVSATETLQAIRQLLHQCRLMCTQKSEPTQLCRPN